MVNWFFILGDFFPPKLTLPDISINTPIVFWLEFTKYIFFQLLTYLYTTLPESLFSFLWFYYIFVNSDDVDLLSGVFIPLIFSEIKMFNFKPTILLFYLFFVPLSVSSFLLSFGLFEHFKYFILRCFVFFLIYVFKKVHWIYWGDTG